MKDHAFLPESEKPAPQRREVKEISDKERGKKGGADKGDSREVMSESQRVGGRTGGSRLVGKCPKAQRTACFHLPSEKKKKKRRKKEKCFRKKTGKFCNCRGERTVSDKRANLEAKERGKKRRGSSKRTEERVPKMNKVFKGLSTLPRLETRKVFFRRGKKCTSEGEKREKKKKKSTFNKEKAIIDHQKKLRPREKEDPGSVREGKRRRVPCTAGSGGGKRKSHSNKGENATSTSRRKKP